MTYNETTGIQRTANEGIAIIAAVTPQIMQRVLASYYPAASSVEAATTQSRFYVSSNARATVQF
jgi:hypothetical protein